MLIPDTPAAFVQQHLIADETEKWGKVVKFAGLSAGTDRHYLFQKRPSQRPIRSTASCISAAEPA